MKSLKRLGTRLKIARRKTGESEATAGPAEKHVEDNAHPTFPPPPPMDILRNSNEYNIILSQRKFFAPPSAGGGDSPLFALYRMYEHLMLNGVRGLRNELERFWYNKWPVKSIPDPDDSAEPDRYAVLACIPALMVTAFNERVRIGIPRWAESIILEEEMDAVRNAEKVYEEVPDWTFKVPPARNTIQIPHEEGEVLETFDDKRTSTELAAKNILCWKPHIHFM